MTNLPTPVAVIDGDIFPLVDFEYSIETDAIDYGITTWSAGAYNVTHFSETISGSITSIDRDLPDTFERNSQTMYLFPREGGTRNRVMLNGVVLSGIRTSDDPNMPRYITAEFVAKEVEKA